MSPLGIVPAFDPLEDRLVSFSSGFERCSVDQFCFQRVKKHFAMCIVPAIASSRHARNDANQIHFLSEFFRGVLRALIRVRNLRAPEDAGQLIRPLKS
jgi:hypothetical protein